MVSVVGERSRAMIANMGEGRPKNTVENSTVSQTKASGDLNVSRESVIFARKVIENATPEVIAPCPSLYCTTVINDRPHRAPMSFQRSRSSLIEQEHLAHWR